MNYNKSHSMRSASGSGVIEDKHVGGRYPRHFQAGSQRKKVLGLIISAVIIGATPAAFSSSHREAPHISTLPAMDGTDLYMFRSYEADREDYVTLLANYYPLQEPGGGPFFFNLETAAVYQIHVDNNGDSIEDLTFSFDFTNVFSGVTLPVGDMNVPIPIVNAGEIGPMMEDTANVNVRQEYRATLIRGPRHTGTASAITSLTGEAVFRKPVDNIGAKSIPDYQAYADDHIYNVSFPGCPTPGRVFVGQRQEGFAVNVGPIFDLVNLNPLGSVDAVENPLSSKNITTLAVEVPVACLTAGNEPVIGAWTTSSLVTAEGTFRQVSRLGTPLVNEVVIGIPAKDRFNASEPKDDAQFAAYVTNPTLPALLEILFGDAGAVAPTNFPRMDLVEALTGVTGVTKPGNADFRRSEMLRLNTGIPITPLAAQDNLGVLGGDNAGFPNGRRPGDDVVDAELRVMMGALNPDATQAPNNALPFTDQTTVSAQDFLPTFPYLNAPLPGAGSN